MGRESVNIFTKSWVYITFVLVRMCVHLTVQFGHFLGKVRIWSRGLRPGEFETADLGCLPKNPRDSACMAALGNHYPTWPQPLGDHLALPRPQAVSGQAPVVCPAFHSHSQPEVLL